MRQAFLLLVIFLLGCTAALQQSKGKPDLVVDSLSATYDGNKVYYSYSIKNIGKVSAPMDGPNDVDWDNLSVQAVVSSDEIYQLREGDKAAGGTILGHSPLGELKPGQSIPDSFAATVGYIDLNTWPFLVLKVDMHNFIEEADENNNTLAVRMERKELPKQEEIQAKSSLGGALVVEHKQDAQLVSSRTYRNWLKCNNIGEPVGEEPDFECEGGWAAYRSAFGAVIFTKDGQSHYCVHLMGWQLLGFQTAVSEDLDAPVVVFVAKGNEGERFFDVLNKKEVYKVAGKGLVVSSQKPVAPGKVIEVRDVFSGDNSLIKTRESQLVKSDEDWRALWERHNGAGKKAPDVDFKKHWVIAYFKGDFVNTSGVKLVEARELDSVLRVRIDMQSYQTSVYTLSPGENSSDGFDKVTPFGMFVIPQTDRKIVLEEDVQNLIGGPSVWKTRAEFNP